MSLDYWKSLRPTAVKFQSVNALGFVMASALWMVANERRAGGMNEWCCFCKQCTSCRVCPAMYSLVYFTHMNLLTSPELLTFLGLLIFISACRIWLNFGMEICKMNESNCESSFFTVKHSDLVPQSTCLADACLGACGIWPLFWESWLPKCNRDCTETKEMQNTLKHSRNCHLIQMQLSQ